MSKPSKKVGCGSVIGVFGMWAVLFSVIAYVFYSFGKLAYDLLT